MKAAVVVASAGLWAVLVAVSDRSQMDMSIKLRSRDLFLLYVLRTADSVHAAATADACVADVDVAFAVVMVLVVVTGRSQINQPGFLQPVFVACAAHC